MAEDDKRDADASLVSASAWMALGTIVSRITGFARSILIIAALGISLNADVFAAANTIPNAMYILVAGGIFNVVLVPQLVRAMRSDDDGGDAYAHRIITLGLLVLAVGTLLLMLLIPVLMRIVFDARLFNPEFADARHSAQVLMYLCMPQVFFYGAFVLIGQVLNARRRFGPMMWAPIVNNAVSIALLSLYIAWFGTSNASDGFTTDQMLLLGIGSTLGIACQTATLLPFLRRTGFRYRARFDFRGTGLGHTIRLGGWTLLFIVANQIAYIVVQRLGTSGTLSGAERGEQGSGIALYELGFLISQVPHGVITVSLATALMPTLASLSAADDLAGMRQQIDRIVRTALVMILPIALLVAILGPYLAVFIGFGGASEGTNIMGNTIRSFSVVMVVFCIHFLMLRGFYAHENTRTPFFIQLVIAVVNIGTAITLVWLAAPAQVSMMLALSLGVGYSVGAVLSVTLLSRQIGPIFGRQTVRFVRRMIVACALFAATAAGTSWGWNQTDLIANTTLDTLVLLIVSTGSSGLVFLICARLLRIDELNLLIKAIVRRR